MTVTKVHGPDSIVFDGRSGDRYWVEQHAAIFGKETVDDRLSSFPLAVFVPPGAGAHTALVIALQGMGAPYGWNAFLVPTLLDMGIAVAMIDHPLAGERSLVRAFDGNIARECLPLLEHADIALDVAAMAKVVELVHGDMQFARQFVSERYGVRGPLGLFGVSLGGLLAGYAFLRHGLGDRLLGVITHLDLSEFARSYGGIVPAAVALVDNCLGPAFLDSALPMALPASVAMAAYAPAALTVLRMLRRLSDKNDAVVRSMNPATFLDNAGQRPVRLLVGADDPLVKPSQVQRLAAQLPNGAAYVVPGLAHGSTQPGGPDFVQHARYFVTSQLGDWRR